ncbi:MAG: zinc ABC transporter substrate-binding protein [Aigarchaeota archaeon]|nr:zinc ABC transporter substrate-binding protein [Aigarchaeota archaeon]
MRLYMALALLSILLTGLSQGASSETQVKVAVTMPALGAVVEEVGGERVQVISLLPQNVDPHSYEPSIESILEAISGASMVVMSGPSHLPIEEKIRRLAEEGLLTASITDHRDYEIAGLLLLRIPETGVINPHGYFFSFSGQMSIAKACAAKLKKIDPLNANYYEERLSRYLQRLSKLEERIKAMDVGGVDVIIGGPDLQYLAEDLDLNVVDIVVKAHGVEPTTQDVIKAINMVKKGEASAVIMSDIEAGENPTLLGMLRDNDIPYVIVPVSELVDEPELIPLVTASLMKNGLGGGAAGTKTTGGLMDFIAVPSLAANLVLLLLVILLLIKVKRYVG